jgi:hypothetical protein
MHILSNEEKEKLIGDSVERDTAEARKRVEDAEAASQKEQDDMNTAENEGLMNRESEKRFQQRMVAIRDCLSDLARSDDVEDGEDEDDGETEQGKLSNDDIPSWVMGTMTKTVKQYMERFQQKKMKFAKLTQPEWADSSECFSDIDKKLSTSELRVPAGIKL